MRNGWRRTLVVGTALAAFVGATAADCGGKGNVTKVEWGEDSRGNKECDITVRPDDLDSAPFKLKDQRASRCRRCPVGARWPECNKNADPTPGGAPDARTVVLRG